MKYILILAILLTACGNDKKQTTVAESSSNYTATDSSCYERYVEFPGELFTENDLRQLTNVEESVETETFITEPGKLGCETGCAELTHSWSAGRKNKWGTDDPFYVRIELSMLNKRYLKDPLDHFNQTYRVLSDEERANLKAQMQQGIDDKVAKGELTKEQADMARSFTKGQVTNKKTYEKVKDLGDAAVWQPDHSYKPTFGQLYLLVGNYIFTIKVDVGTTDAEQSKELAKKVAQQIINKC